MKPSTPLLFFSLLALTSAFPLRPISRTVTINPSRNINARAGTDTAAGILNIIGGAIPGQAGAIVGDVGKGLGGKGAAGAAGAGTGTAAAAGSATTGNAKAKAGAAGGATKAAGKKAAKAA